MLTFYLTRHGQKENIPFDPPLTETGNIQAELTAKFLKKIPFKSIISSQKLRSKQTAEIIAIPHALDVVIDERLQERLEWENNETFIQFVARWDQTDLDRDFTPIDGLSSHDNGRQMRKILEELAEKYIDGEILIVSHGGTIGDLLRELFTEKAIYHKTYPDGGGKYIEISECSISIIQKNGANYKLTKLNDSTHTQQNKTP